jgi:hypothetical protein
MLAKATGWSERFILWELPLVRLVSYEHANLRANDIWTVHNAPITEQSIAPVIGFFDAPTIEGDETDDY